MNRKRNPVNSRKQKSEVAKNHSVALIDIVSDNEISDGIAESARTSAKPAGDYEYDEYVRKSKCDKCKHNCDEVCSKYKECCNFTCASDKELLIRIICLLIDKEYGLKAIEQKMRKSELNDDLKNIKSISDLLERAVVGLGETAVSAVKKAVDAAGTMTDITSGLAKIAAGAAGTAGSTALTASGLASVAQGAAGTAGAASFTTFGLANTVAGTAGTAGAVANTAAATAGVAAAGAVTTGAAVDAAAEASGLAAAGAATIGAAGDVAVETAGLAAAGAATTGAAADVVSGEAATAAAVSSTQASIANVVAGEAATAAAVSGTKASIADVVAQEAGTAAAVSGTQASIANVVAGEAATAAAVSNTKASIEQTAKDASVSRTDDIHTEVVTTGPVTLDTDEDFVQVWVVNNNNVPTKAINVIMYNLTVNPQPDHYVQSSAAPADSSVLFTIASVPAVCEIQIQGLTRNILAYAVALKKTDCSSKSQAPVVARILCTYP